ncbi:MAG: dihydrofolate reductase family protein [Agriterribacter sp.]
MNADRKLAVYIAMSLDGYISKPNDDLGFLALVQKEGEDYGYANFVATIDTVILGRKTYDWVMKQVDVFPHHDKQTFVITSTARPAVGNAVFYTGSLEALVSHLKSRPGKNIFCDGGAQVIDALIKADLVDEYIISIVPVLLGEGTKLFRDDRLEQRLHFLKAQAFDTGLVQLHYSRSHK